MTGIKPRYTSSRQHLGPNSRKASATPKERLQRDRAIEAIEACFMYYQGTSDPPRLWGQQRVLETAAHILDTLEIPHTIFSTLAAGRKPTRSAPDWLTRSVCHCALCGAKNGFASGHAGMTSSSGRVRTGKQLKEEERARDVLLRSVRARMDNRTDTDTDTDTDTEDSK